MGFPEDNRAPPRQLLVDLGNKFQDLSISGRIQHHFIFGLCVGLKFNETRYLAHCWQVPEINHYRFPELGWTEQVEIKHGILWRELKASCQIGRPSQGYLDIMANYFLPDAADTTFHKCIQAVDMAITKGDTTQKFLQNKGSTVVSAVIFKYQRPCSVATVSPEDLKAMGWIKDTDDERYWRYEKGNLEKEDIFQVEMDGTIRGIWTPEGNISVTSMRDSA